MKTTTKRAKDLAVGEWLVRADGSEWIVSKVARYSGRVVRVTSSNHDAYLATGDGERVENLRAGAFVRVR